MKPRLGRVSSFAMAGLAAISLLTAAAAVAQVPTPKASAGKPVVKAPVARVLSSDPRRVTGGDALIEIVSPALGVTVTVGGRNLTGRFARDPASGNLRGVVDGLRDGANAITVTAGGARANLAVTNHPLMGPLFSGPHQTPFVCETHAFRLPDGSTLGRATDANCSAPTNVQYVYKSTADGTLKPFNPTGARPADLAKAKIKGGAEVDYIVRLETGVINRAIYQIAMINPPGGPLPTPVARAPGWNGVLLYTFGGGCGVAFRQGRGTGAVINNGEIGNDGLDQGYALASATLNVQGANCNDVTSAETATMVKEHFIEAFGPPRHTIGVGGSGGAIQQYLLAQNYPGILDGLMPERSFPDTISLAGAWNDCPLLDNYLKNTNLTDAQKAAISGFANYGSCKAWFNYTPRMISPLGAGCDATAFITNTEAVTGISGTRSEQAGPLYDPVKSPKGARCSYFDNAVNIYGRHADGSARMPLDNVGVQYGLAAFNSGAISFDQFADLNQKVGGYDREGRFVAARMVGDLSALRAAYQTGRVNIGRNLANVPIIDVRSYLDRADPSDVHTAFTTQVMRARMVATNGNADNQISWTTPTTGSLRADMQNAKSPLREAMRMALSSMDSWLDAIDRDRSAAPRAAKVLRHKPAGLADACFTDSMEKISVNATYQGSSRCNQLFPNHGDPRIAAGAPLRSDTIKCALQPVSAKLYKQSIGSAQIQRLRDIFPQGVCDYSRPGVAQTPPVRSWVTFPLQVASR